METSKIEELLREIEENQRNVGGAGRHGISVSLGVEPWSGRASLEMWALLPWALSTGPKREGRQPWGGRAHMEMLRYLRPEREIETPNLLNLRSFIKYLAIALPLFISGLR